MADKNYALTFEFSNGSEKSVQFTAPQGPAGADGKSAYEYAQAGGYTGTEAEFAVFLAKAGRNGNGVHYIEGNGTTAGEWTGTCEDIEEYYDGLTIAYKVGIAGASSGTTLNINRLGAVPVVRNITSAVTTQYGVTSVVVLVYTEDNGTAYWKVADYDANTDTQIRVYRQTSNYNGDYPILVSQTKAASIGTAGSNGTYAGVYGVIGQDGKYTPTINPHTGVMKVPGGIAANITGRATQDGAGNVIKDTYVKKSWIKANVMDYGAVGDGVTDDTAAFQTALAAERTVYVPGGTYVLSGRLEIGENCELELSQSTVLQFTQTSGNCIELRRSAVLRGNHGTIFVPYTFTGNAIACDTALDGSVAATVPPYKTVHSMLQYQRFIHDINVMKPNANGEFRSTDGTCSGTAIYLSADGTATFTYLWGVLMDGIRIGGAFSYGVRAVNYDDPDKYADNAWNHDMRIEAVIEACEVGVSLENCNGAHLNVTVQPCQARNGSAYAKWGVYLYDSRFVDMMRSRVWDWNASNSLWTDGGQYQHLAMVGNCRGLLLDDFQYYETGYDIRALIYTDTASNLEQITILQEPFTRWFKPVDNKPYFFDGTSNKQLMLKTDKFSAEQMEFVHEADGYYESEATFTNLVNGYTDGTYVHASGTGSLDGYVTTDFIPIDGAAAHTYRIGGEGITWNDSYGYCRIAWYNADKTLKGSIMAWNKIGSSTYYPTTVEDDTVAAAFATNVNVAPPNGAAYFRVTAKGSGANLIITIDEEVSYIQRWIGEPKRLDDSIYAQNVFLMSPGGYGYKLTVSDGGVLSAEAFE